jgi:hypothetical protein
MLYAVDVPVMHAIANAIAPYIGPTMARTSIAAHSKRLGLDAARLAAGDIERLLEQIALGLNVFIGREKTEKVMRDVRAAIGSQP